MRVARIVWKYILTWVELRSTLSKNNVSWFRPLVYVVQRVKGQITPWSIGIVAMYQRKVSDQAAGLGRNDCSTWIRHLVLLHASLGPRLCVMEK